MYIALDHAYHRVMIADRSDMPGDRSRQKEVGEALRRDTRTRLLNAAQREFEKRGYAATTVARLASAAGVSVQTLYLAWGSKRALLRGYLDQVLGVDAAARNDAMSDMVGCTPQERLAGLADHIAETVGRAATGWAVYRDAATVDPEIAADWEELQTLRYKLYSDVIGVIPAALRAPGLTTIVAVDTAWAIASPESCDLLVRRLDYSVQEFRAWMTTVLTSALLARDGPPAPARP